MADRIAVTHEGKTSQREALHTLRTKLETLGFTTGQNHQSMPENECRWYAWRPLAGGRDCECNEKPPSLIVTPYLYTIRDRQYTSTEVAVTGQRGEWFHIKAYSVNPEALPEALPQIEAAIGRAWNALHGSTP